MKCVMPHLQSNIEWELVKAFEVPGQPIAKARPRMARAGRFVRAYTPKRTLEFEKRVGVFCTAPRIRGKVPVVINMRFIFKRPKRLMRKKDPDGLIPHTEKPDGDNVEKAVLDGLSGVLYNDDSHVFHSSWVKFYAEKNRGPRVELNVWIPSEAPE